MHKTVREPQSASTSGSIRTASDAKVRKPLCVCRPLTSRCSLQRASDPGHDAVRVVEVGPGEANHPEPASRSRSSRAFSRARASLPSTPSYLTNPSNSTTTSSPTRKSTRPMSPSASVMTTWERTDSPAPSRISRVRLSPGDSDRASAPAIAARARPIPKRAPGRQSAWVNSALLVSWRCNAASMATTPASTPLAVAVSTHAAATGTARGEVSLASTRWLGSAA